ncbi:AsmA family protein [Marinobacter halophilus]|uniref:AsmA family protein n=1 Tax=Marinobacter halophilus TaxID=1323740 RepID=A0A2T1KEH6_9GAMM|nr:AsmA family protein [Marinobacter halophilus]PSF08531.1 AsmA family protein [Marinobacter halophilus]GGC61437.1 cell envelope biogenesis protein AsmA [Marinobacter halophilus]
MKVIRYALYAVIALVLLAVIAVAIAVAVINPNDYKPHIEAAVKKHSNLELIIDGDIGWSFIPLGLELNQVEATLEGERFVALEQLIAQIDFWSLIAMSPQVNTFLLNGLDARLEVNEQGEGNWARIMPERDADSVVTDTEEPTAETTEETGAGDTLNFNVENVEISNARVHYNDLSTGQSATLEDLSVSASNITLGSEFPLDIRFKVETAQPQLTVNGSINARMKANEALNEFAMSGLNAVFDMSGEPFGGKSVTAEMGGSLVANLESETASLTNFSASLANLELSTNLNVKGFGDTPAVDGRMEISSFSLKQLLSNLGQPELETEDPEVLKAIALSVNLGGQPGTVALSDLNITLDDTSFNGSGSYDLATGGLVFNLQGDKINADRYLPPASEGEEDAAPQQTAEAGPEADLLPLETLRTLLLDIDLGLGELIVSNLTIRDIKASTTAKDGLVQLDEFSGKLYEGSFGANVTIDARTDNPKWRLRSDVTGVQTLPLLTDLAEVDMLSGAANMKVAIDTNGNRVSTLLESAKGEISFNLAEGLLRNINLTRMACQGIALANQDTLSATDWGTHTPFNDMRGTLKIDGNILNNTDLVAALAGMRLEGNGTVDLAQTQLDYELGLRIVGEIHRDNACRVTEYVENVVIPVECRGNFADDPASLCSFDGSRFRDTLKDIAANAARAKVREETDKAKERVEEKAREEIDKRLGEEGDSVRDAVRGLFNR